MPEYPSGWSLGPPQRRPPAAQAAHRRPPRRCPSPTYLQAVRAHSSQTTPDHSSAWKARPKARTAAEALDTQPAWGSMRRDVTERALRGCSNTRFCPLQAQEHSNPLPGPRIHTCGDRVRVRGRGSSVRPLRRDHDGADAGAEGRRGVPEGGASDVYFTIVTAVRDIV